MTAPAATGVPVNKFEGDGVPFKGKLIGMEDLKIDRDEKVCLDSMFKLKAVASARGEHKQRIQLNLTLTGVKVYDDASKMLLASHEVERISFVVLDPRDNRAFGYVYNTSDDRHQFWAIKSERASAATVLALKELFELAFEEFTKTEKAKIKGDQPVATPASVPVPATVQEQSLFSTSIPSASSTLLASPPTAVSQPAAASTMPLGDDLWGPGPTPAPAQSPQPTSSRVDELDLWGAPEPAKPAAVQDSLDDMFGAFASTPTPPPPTPVVPTLPPPPAVPRLPPMPAFPAMPPRPTAPIVPPPVSNVSNNDIMSMFSPAAPAPAASNAMFAQPTPQLPVIPQQPPQPNLLMATPAPAVVPPAAAKSLAEFDLLGDFA